MGQKDRSEKYLESYHDVFADILNVLLFQKNVICSDGLKDSSVESVFRSGTGYLGTLRRDVFKEYYHSNFAIAAFGIENQATIDKDMPIRVMGYDYTAYRYQMEHSRERFPVITIVLNFSDKEWYSPLSLKESLKLPKELEAYVQDYKIYVYNIAYLPKEIRSHFQSDFKIVADFFSERRIGNYQPSQEVIQHVEAVLELLRVFTGDKRYEKIKDAILVRHKKGGLISMCTFAEEMTQRGIKQGLKQGVEKGLEQGLSKGLKALVTSLKYCLGDFSMVYEAVIANEEYADVTEDEVRKYYTKDSIL